MTICKTMLLQIARKFAIAQYYLAYDRLEQHVENVYYVLHKQLLQKEIWNNMHVAVGYCLLNLRLTEIDTAGIS